MFSTYVLYFVRQTANRQFARDFLNFQRIDSGQKHHSEFRPTTPWHRLQYGKQTIYLSYLHYLIVIMHLSIDCFPRATMSSFETIVLYGPAGHHLSLTV